MKKVILLSLLIGFAVSASAMCGNRYLRPFPSNVDIAPNTVFMFEAYGESHDIFEQIKNGNPLYLEADGQRINLVMVSVNTGMFAISQMLMRPAEKLKFGKTYFLRMDSLSDLQKGDLLGWKNGKATAIRWKVTKPADTKAPEWTSKPKYDSSSCEFFGCGPAMFAIFACAIADESETSVQVEFSNAKNGKKHVYILQLKNGKIELGHGMCSGAFTFGKGKRFAARFMLVDASGNKSGQYTKLIKFNTPYKEFSIGE